MKLRVRINRQTSKVELVSEEPSLTELKDLIKQMLLSSHGLSANTDFSLSLNGSELLSDLDQTLASCGIISGDLICVLLPQPLAAAVAPSDPTINSTNTTTNSQQTASQTTGQVLDQLMSGTEPQQTPEMEDSGLPPPVWEPMLCSEVEDGQAPLSLDLLYHTARTTSPNDAIMVAAHLLMLETGFAPQGCEVKAGEMPAGWRSASGVYRLQYTHPLCENSLASVVGVGMGPLLVVNATLKVTETIDSVQKLQLNVSSYVTNEWPGGSAAAAFKDLKKLSRIFKDQLAYPLIAAAREAMALPVAFGLPVLPPELLLRVLRLLDARSVVRLSAASRHFNTAAADSTLWRHLYRRDFPDPDGSRSRDTDWKELYKKTYQSRSRLRHVLHHHPHLPLPYRDIITTPRPFIPPIPGIIGGEYDQRPTLPYSLLPRPRYDPIGPIADPGGRPLRRPPLGGRADVRRGFI
ncbi:F-box only protein 7 isoform X2 [Melanotaenia boesemani]|uniref:F-box only protein 7 isoform X2 n=1 Tax=Melanotaenia boesemani TaxID=1250792 RepID=UPI001C053150|nr:F-box only protein 7 isoform X2 [Melanotaenia boesemani]